MEKTLTPSATRKLDERAPLPVDPSRSIAVKRDVHEFVVDTDAATFAAAFREVVTDPDSTFGLIHVKRAAARLGREFQVGDRFQGCFSLERAARAFAAERVPGANAVLSALFAFRPAGQLVGWIEDQLLSNYAEVEEIVITPDLAAGEAYQLRYRYLDGTPIAGRSTFTIEPDAGAPGHAHCRVTQIFEYQEVNSIALGTFQRFGLKYHDQVVHMEIEKAAARAGARIVSGTIPRRYAELSGGGAA